MFITSNIRVPRGVSKIAASINHHNLVYAFTMCHGAICIFENNEVVAEKALLLHLYTFTRIFNERNHV